MKKILKAVKGIVAALLAMVVLFIGVICYIWFGVLRPYYNLPNDLKYVAEYDVNSGLVDDDVLASFGSEESYKLGVNEEGNVIFINPKDAYKTARKACDDAVDFAHSNYDIKHCSRTYYLAYIDIAEEVQNNPDATAEIKEQAQLFADVLTIYCNSFNKHR